MDYVIIRTDNYLQHHGILGQKWGVRRYQNADGTLTDAGKKRQRIKDQDKQDIKDVAKSSAKIGAGVTLAGTGVKLLSELTKYYGVESLANLPVAVLGELGYVGGLEGLATAAGFASLPVAGLALGVAGTAGLVGTGAAMVKRYFKRHSESDNK